MTLRRVVALMVALSLLVLSASRADAACAGHGEHKPAGAVAHEALAVFDHHGDHPTPAKQNDACDTPLVPECCEALVSCSMTVGGSEALRVDDVRFAHASIGLTPESAPMSRIAPPEPPPPRR